MIRSVPSYPSLDDGPAAQTVASHDDGIAAIATRAWGHTPNSGTQRRRGMPDGICNRPCVRTVREVEGLASPPTRASRGPPVFQHRDRWTGDAQKRNCRRVRTTQRATSGCAQAARRSRPRPSLRNIARHIVLATSVRNADPPARGVPRFGLVISPGSIRTSADDRRTTTSRQPHTCVPTRRSARRAANGRERTRVSAPALPKREAIWGCRPRIWDIYSGLSSGDGDRVPPFLREL